MSWLGTMIGLPLAGLRMLLVDIISTRASSCASRERGTWTAIWSPSKSALKAVQTSGWSWIALPSISTGSKAWMPRRWSVGGRSSPPVGAERPAPGPPGAERLEAGGVGGWGAVQEHRVLADHLLQDVPD